MKEIILSSGEKAQVSDEDFETLRYYAWSKSSKGYARRGEGPRNDQKWIFMHNMVFQRMGYTGSPDHKDRDKLNNQRENLRVATGSQNQANRSKPANNTSGYKGGSLCKQTGKWRASIHRGRVKMDLGRFSTPEQAALAYNKAALRMYGEFAFLNTVNT